MSVPAAYLGVIIIWSTTPLAIQWSSEGWGFMFAVSARMLLGAVLCLLVMRVLGYTLPWHRQALKTYLAAGAGVYGAMSLVYWGAQFIHSGLIAVLFALSPIITGILAAVWLNEKNMTAGRLGAALLGFVGVTIIFQSEIDPMNAAWQGIVAILVAALIHSASAIWIKRIAEPLPGLTVTTGTLIVVSPLYLLSWWLLDGEIPVEIPVSPVGALLYLVVFGSVIGWSMYFYVLKNVEASRAALITLVTPVVALFLGQAINGETISPAVWYGTLCIMFALVLYQWGDALLGKVIRRQATLKYDD